MMVYENIETKLLTRLDPVHLEVINESYMHSVPPKSETHFKVVVVSNSFVGKNRVARHQLINKLLEVEIAGPVHALSIQAHTQEEWEARGGVLIDTPACLGRNKIEHAK